MKGRRVVATLNFGLDILLQKIVTKKRRNVSDECVREEHLLATARILIIERPSDFGTTEDARSAWTQRGDGRRMALAQWMEAAGTTRSATSHFATVDGAGMHYLKVGNGPDLSLVHGLLGSAACWEPCFEQLAAQSTVYAVDALGMGGSDRVEGLDVSLG